jgi:hypothetical protein
MLRKLITLGFAALLIAAFFGCGPKEAATDESGEPIPTADECSTALTEYLNGLTAWTKENMEVPNDEYIAKFTEATGELNTMSETWAGYGDDYADVADMAAKSAAYYEATAGFMGLDQAKASEEEKDAAFAKVEETMPGWNEINEELELE